MPVVAFAGRMRGRLHADRERGIGEHADLRAALPRPRSPCRRAAVGRDHRHVDRDAVLGSLVDRQRRIEVAGIAADDARRPHDRRSTASGRSRMLLQLAGCSRIACSASSCSPLQLRDLVAQLRGSRVFRCPESMRPLHQSPIGRATALDRALDRRDDRVGAAPERAERARPAAAGVERDQRERRSARSATRTYRRRLARRGPAIPGASPRYCWVGGDQDVLEDVEVLEALPGAVHDRVAAGSRR